MSRDTNNAMLSRKGHFVVKTYLKRGTKVRPPVLGSVALEKKLGTSTFLPILKSVYGEKLFCYVLRGF